MPSKKSARQFLTTFSLIWGSKYFADIPGSKLTEFARLISVSPAVLKGFGTIAQESLTQAI